MKTRVIHRFALLASCVLLIGSLALWIRTQQRQYAVNRALIAALMKGDSPTALALVEAGADPNTRYQPPPAPSLFVWITFLRHSSSPSLTDNPTAFAIVCGAPWGDQFKRFYGTIEGNFSAWDALVQEMLTHGADVNARNNVTEGQSGHTPLHWAAYRNLAPTVLALLRHGANVNVTDAGGHTPLMEATDGCHLPMVRLLLQHGAQVNAQDGEGNTALRFVVGFDRDDASIIRELIAHGANPGLANKQGETPLSIAREHNPPEIVALLSKGRKLP